MHTVGPLLLDVLLLAVGEGALAAVGFVRTRRQAVVYAGLAFVLGWCAVGVAVSISLMLGGSLALWQPVVLAGVLVAAALVVARRIPAAVEPPPLAAAAADARLFGRVAAGVLVAYTALLGIRAAFAGSPAIWDGWAFWIPKAKAIFYFHGLKPHLEGGYASFAHVEYPPLVPAMDATVFRFAGAADQLLLPFQDWLLAAAFLGALAALLHRRVPGHLLWPALLVLALAPDFAYFIGSGLGDPPLARVFALAAVCGALWLVGRDWRLLAVAGILLAGASETKGEGMLFGLLLCVGLVVGAAFERPRRVWPALLLAPVAILAAVPWQIWLSATGVTYSPDYKLSDAVRPSYLSDRVSRLGTALERLPGYALGLDRWLLLVPVALVLAVLLVRRRPSLAAFVVGIVTLGYLGLSSVYWVSTLPLGWYINTSAERVTSSLVFVCGALTPLLAAELFRKREEAA
jgi:hypothetical protein